MKIRLAAKAEQAEQIMTEAKENFNAVLEVTFSEHKQEIKRWKIIRLKSIRFRSKAKINDGSKLRGGEIWSLPM